MAVMTVRGLEDSVVQALKEIAKKENTTVNSVLINIIKERLGLKKKPQTTIHHNLDRLAGTWSEEDYLEFQSNVTNFEKIDESLWKK